MAKRHIASLALTAVTLILSVVLLQTSFSSDLASGAKFLLKTSYFHTSIILLLILSINSIVASNTLNFAGLGIGLLCLLPLNLSQLGRGEKVDASPAQTLSVASFSAMTRTRNGADIVAWLNQEDFDLVCLQEVLPVDLSDLPDSYYSTKTLQQPLVTLSKIPLRIITSNSHYQLTELIFPPHRIVVANVHLPRQYRSSIEAQAVYQQLQQALAAANSEALILCGDFNMTPYNSLYAILKDQWYLRDSHIDAGRGLGLTFPSGNRRLALFGPQIRIDYIFSRGLLALNSRTRNVSPASDHLAIEAVLQMRQ